MISSISATTPFNVAAEPAPKGQKQHQPKATAPAQDSVLISSAALTAVQAKPVEALETYAQTLKEASVGDPQAVAKLAKK
jgi:hypothetical protein